MLRPNAPDLKVYLHRAPISDDVVTDTPPASFGGLRSADFV